MRDHWCDFSGLFPRYAFWKLPCGLFEQSWSGDFTSMEDWTYKNNWKMLRYNSLKWLFFTSLIMKFAIIWMVFAGAYFFRVNVGIITILSGSSVDSWQAVSTYISFVFLSCSTVRLIVETSTFCSFSFCCFSFFILAQDSWEETCFIFLQCYQILLVLKTSLQQITTHIDYLIHSQIINYVI